MKSNQILLTLKEELKKSSESFGEVGAEVRRNVAKEVLQYFVLNFIYLHPLYNHWIMYGGSALRLCHGLDRMSVDLDFEVVHEITNEFLDQLKTELFEYFEKSYGVDSEMLTIGVTNHRGLTLKFHVAEELDLLFHSKQIHVKVDLNHFSTAPRITTERWPQNKYQLSFIITTYNMASLMASKIAAIFLRGERGVGNVIFHEKGRDIYDLLWYMGKKIVPDLDYLRAKHVEESKDLRTLFDKLTLKMNDVSDKNLKQDIVPLFVNQSYIENWLRHWRESYMRSLDEYQIHTVTTLKGVDIHQNYHNDIFSFVFQYNTEESKSVRISYKISDYWLDQEGDLKIPTDKKMENLVEFYSDGIGRPAPRDKLLQYATLFYEKTESYLNKTNRVMVGNEIVTKLIRTNADNLDRNEQVHLNPSALRSCELEDLLK